MCENAVYFIIAAGSFTAHPAVTLRGYPRSTSRDAGGNDGPFCFFVFFFIATFRIVYIWQQVRERADCGWANAHSCESLRSSRLSMECWLGAVSLFMRDESERVVQCTTDYMGKKITEKLSTRSTHSPRGVEMVPFGRLDWRCIFASIFIEWALMILCGHLWCSNNLVDFNT